MIYTKEFVASAPKARIAVEYPDGARLECEVLSEGMLVGMILGAAYQNRVGDCSRELDELREAHAKAGTAWAAVRS